MSELTELVDALSLSEDSELKKIFTNGNLPFLTSVESVFLSCKVKKFNKYNMKQERTLAVTEKHLYSLKGKSKLPKIFTKFT